MYFVLPQAGSCAADCWYLPQVAFFKSDEFLAILKDHMAPRNLPHERGEGPARQLCHGIFKLLISAVALRVLLLLFCNTCTSVELQGVFGCKTVSVAFHAMDALSRLGRLSVTLTTCGTAMCGTENEDVPMCSTSQNL